MRHFANVGLGFVVTGLAVGGWPAIAAVAAGDDRPNEHMKKADELFQEGKFAEAGERYAKAVAEQPADETSLARLGEIALLSNRLAEAERYLNKALEAAPDHRGAKTHLAEVYYRQDRFASAAPLFREIGKTAMADTLAGFAGRTPYEVADSGETFRVKFVLTDPLPVMKARVNGGDEVHFILDTGASEVYIDPELAKKAEAATFGESSGVFGGGKRATFQHGRIDSLHLGDLEIRNLPVHVLDTSKFSVAAGGNRVFGIIGTVLLYHFVSTIDYPKGELVLRRIGSEALGELDAAAAAGAAGGRSKIIPFWMAGDHFMVAWGTVNNGPATLLFVDTGLAGGGFTCPKSTIDAAGIQLSDASFEGVGGGGKVKATPFVVEQLTLGGVKREKIPSFFGPFPESLEMGMGFRMGGIISHGFFRPFAVTFDFTRMRLHVAGEE